MTDTHDQIGTGPLQWLQEEIEAVVTQRQEELRQISYWRKPLVAVAAADNPLFSRLREVVDPEHAMPEDLLPGARSVIVFFIPFQPELGRENDREEFFASRNWAESYVITNQLIASINARLKKRLQEAGYDAAETPATHNFDEVKLVSRWSHKHLGYIAGLGTFGLHHLLITPVGCCGRLGSLVTSMPLPPTPRPEEEWCLTKAGYKCSACITKCRYGALCPDGFDKSACYRQCLRTDAHYSDLPLVDVCGKCASEVPCSRQVPPRLTRLERETAV